MAVGGVRTQSLVNSREHVQLTATQKLPGELHQKIRADEPLIGSSASGDGNNATQTSKDHFDFKSRRDEVLYKMKMIKLAKPVSEQRTASCSNANHEKGGIVLRRNSSVSRVYLLTDKEAKS